MKDTLPKPGQLFVISYDETRISNSVVVIYQKNENRQTTRWTELRHGVVVCFLGLSYPEKTDFWYDVLSTFGEGRVAGQWLYPI